MGYAIKTRFETLNPELSKPVTLFITSSLPA